MNYSEKAAELLNAVRAKKPLLHHITNHVVMNDNANIAIHIGASPIMAHAHDEIEELIAIADTLVINIGTLDDYWIKSMKIAGKAAAKKKIPIVLDPVGAGATKLRTTTVLNILGDYPVSIVKGNAGEIASLAGIGGKVRGVDSEGGEQMEGAVALAKRFATVVAVTGKEDFISDGTRVLKVSNGSEWLGTITGSGCSATSVVAAFASAGSDQVENAAAALAVYSVAAEHAELRNPEGPATFKRYFFDSIYSVNEALVRANARIEEVR